MPKRSRKTPHNRIILFPAQSPIISERDIARDALLTVFRDHPLALEVLKDEHIKPGLREALPDVITDIIITAKQKGVI